MAAKKRAPFTAVQLRAFVAHIKRHCAVLFPTEIARVWNETVVPGSQAPLVNTQRVQYWVNRLRIIQDPAKIRRSGENKKAVDRRRVRSADAQRKTFRTRATNRRKAFLLSRDRQLRTDPLCPVHSCPKCTEPFPITAEFFYRKTDPKTGERKFELLSCRTCRGQRSSELYRASKRGGAHQLKQETRARLAQIALTRIEHERQLALGKVRQAEANFRSVPVRDCCACKGAFVLSEEAFIPNPNHTGTFKYTCRFCYRRFQVLFRLAKRCRDANLMSATKRERDAATAKGTLVAVRERRNALVQQSLKVRGIPQRHCPQCQQSWPETADYWTERKSKTAGNPVKVLCFWSCRCCFNERQVKYERRKKIPAKAKKDANPKLKDDEDSQSTRDGLIT